MAGELLERCTLKATTSCSNGPVHAADGARAAGDDDMELAAQQDLVLVLPHDVMASVFRRLAPRCLAVSRCVCRDWRAAIDDRRLLRADLLPLSCGGIFVHFCDHKFPELLARPTSTEVGAITGSLDFLPNTDPYFKFKITDIKDHCNGFLLLEEYVVNPATRRWDPLPPCPPPHHYPLVVHTDDQVIQCTSKNFLAFDPTVSPHYEVFQVPHICPIGIDGDAMDPMVEESRLFSLSSTCALPVFSSRYGRWEWRSFVREGSAAEAVRRVKCIIKDLGERAVYRRGALYVQRNANFVVRISLSNNRYRVISPPAGLRQSSHPTRYLERSENGVYFAALDNYRLQVWILNESSGQTAWMLKLDKDIAPLLARPWEQQVYNFPTLKERTRRFNSGQNKKADIGRDTVKDWYVPDEDPLIYNPNVRILGFHPYKEVIFLSEPVDKHGHLQGSVDVEKGLAYHLNTSKVKDLGDIRPTKYPDFHYDSGQSIRYSFIYTPCWLEEFPRNS